MLTASTQERDFIQSIINAAGRGLSVDEIIEAAQASSITLSADLQLELQQKGQITEADLLSEHVEAAANGLEGVELDLSSLTSPVAPDTNATSALSDLQAYDQMVDAGAVDISDEASQNDLLAGDDGAVAGQSVDAFQYSSSELPGLESGKEFDGKIDVDSLISDGDPAPTSNQQEPEASLSTQEPVGKKTSDKALEDALKSSSPEGRAMEAIQRAYGEDGEVSIEVLKEYFEKFDVSPDDPIYKEIQKQYSLGNNLLSLRALKEAGSKPATPTPAENNAGASKNNKPNKGASSPKQKPNTPDSENMVAAGHVVSVDLGKPIEKFFGGIKGVAAGSAEQVNKLIAQQRARKVQLASNLDDQIRTANQKLETISEIRSQIGKAANALEKRDLANKLKPTLSEFRTECNALSEILSTSKGKAAAKQPGAKGKLEDLMTKATSVFKNMEPGKGEKRAFDAMAESIDSALKAVQALLEKISAVVMKGPTQDQTSGLRAPSNGP